MNDEFILDSWCDDDDEDALLKIKTKKGRSKKENLDEECAAWLQTILDLAEEGYWEE